MDAGLRGSRLPRGRALALRLAAIVAFLALWSLLSGAVVVLKLFNPIFLPGPWLVLGSVLDMAVRGPLWIHLAATLERVAMGFGVGARGVALFTRVILPAALPDILTGLRLGVALAFFVIVISEFIGAEHGLGYLINDGRNFFLVPQMLGAAVVLGLLGYAGNGLVRLLERRLTRWQHPA